MDTGHGKRILSGGILGLIGLLIVLPLIGWSELYGTIGPTPFILLGIAAVLIIWGIKINRKRQEEK